jgi:hypothetical protein
MQPLVLQLQAECLDAGVSILEVLRKALVVARKLSLTDAQAWIEKELNGYKSGDEAPPHRLLTGQIRSWNPYHGWIPMIFEDHREAAYLSKCFVGQPIGELEDLLKHGTGTLQFPFDPGTEANLMKGMDIPLQTTRHLSRSSVTGIIDAVRNMVLEWCLQLEKDGILGDGMVFSAREKEAASHSNYTINYNGPVVHSQIQQGSPHATQSMTVSDPERTAIAEFIQTLNEHTAELRLDVSAMSSLNAELQAVQKQVVSPNPSRPVLHQSLRTIRNLIEGCAGSLIASGLLFELGKLLK